MVVVDDSALYRQMLQNLLRRIPGVEVVGTAGDGREALALVESLRPDLVTLDVQMPTMDGLAFLRALRTLRLPAGVIMVSSLTSQGAKATTEALFEGAFDVIPKPTGNDLLAGREWLQRELAAKIAAFRSTLLPSPAPCSTGPGHRFPPPRAKPTAAVVIGASTGGPAALRAVLSKLPATLPVPLLVVQHIPAAFSSPLAARLDESSPLAVAEAEAGMAIAAGRALVAPGGLHLTLVRRADQVVCALSEDPLRHGCRPSVDTLLESAVDIFGGMVTAVILTGMGRDGTDGCRLVKERRGRVIAQAPEGCAVYGMPKAVIDEGLADVVAPLEQIADAILGESSGV